MASLLNPDFDPEQSSYIIQRGLKCKALVENEDFLWIVDDQTSWNLQQMLRCKPGDDDALKHAHLMQYALTELVSTLQGYAQAGEAEARVIEMLSQEVD